MNFAGFSAPAQQVFRKTGSCWAPWPAQSGGRGSGEFTFLWSLGLANDGMEPDEVITVQHTDLM